MGLDTFAGEQMTCILERMHGQTNPDNLPVVVTSTLQEQLDAANDEINRLRDELMKFDIEDTMRSDRIAELELAIDAQHEPSDNVWIYGYSSLNIEIRERIAPLIQELEDIIERRK